MASKAISSETVVSISEVTFQDRVFSIYGTFENPLFLAKDVAAWIKYDPSSIHKMLRNVDEEEKVRKIVPTNSGSQESWFLTEHGMYEVLLQSRKPIAKQCKQIIKRHMKELRISGVSVRQNLSFQQQATVLLSKLDEVLIQQEAELAQLNHQINVLGEQSGLLEKEIEIVDKQIKELKPYAEKYNEFLSEDALMTVDDFARIMHPRYKLGRNQLFKWMRNKHMLGAVGRRRNTPSRQLVNNNLLVLLKNQVFITKKGFDYLCDKLDGHFGLN
ncbi:phage antirepressor KilAC domain-containing protein [Bacillus velezensis]|uniref:phage antirepressor KilAC domain-containing protein n=1 Tax=Bacillus velezensis TaxID=492670 RepID=UPI001A93028A|nr:phage antirepressor KilAC domain-containing protein [Bacillus velezensis]BCT30418.1 hypothetical protein BVAD3_40920 [Bacillus velezensis]